jgi:TfoX N-terminal domain
MAYNEILAQRMRDLLAGQPILLEKKMMGGLCFMVDGKMCVGIIGEDLMARIAPEMMETAYQRRGCRAMDFTGRPMKGFVFVSPEGTDAPEALEYWVDLALAFNPFAQASKKK